MAKFKNLLWGMLAMLTTFMMVGCGEKDNPTRTSLEVDTSDLVLLIGESATRTATSKAGDAVITYSSNDPAVATVDQNGKVTGVSAGNATITVSMDESRSSWYAANSVSYKVIVQKAVSAVALKNADKSTPLTLVADEDGKITVYFNGGITLANDIKYTVNGGTEQTIAKNTEGSYDIVLKKGDMVQLYSNNTSLGGSSVAGARGFTRAVAEGSQHINIRPSMKTKIFGNVMSLLKGKDNLESATAIEAPNAFYGLFSGADKLVNSDDRELVLPATTLKEGCYDNMFSGCKGIEKAPELPAPTLVKDCYSGMFSGCSKLSEVKCLATDVSADGCVKDWLADAGKEAETPPVIEVTKEAQSALKESIPATFTTNIAVTKIALEPTALKLMAGETATLKATVEPEDATNKELQWSSSNLRVATVSPDGLSESLEAVVTAVSAGTATITVCTPDGSVSKTCQLTVEALPEETPLIIGKWVAYFGETKKDCIIWTFNENGVLRYQEYDHGKWQNDEEMKYVINDNKLITTRKNKSDGTEFEETSIIKSLTKSELVIDEFLGEKNESLAFDRVSDDFVPPVWEDETQEDILVTNISLPESYTCGGGIVTGVLASGIFVIPSNATNQSVTWISDNPNVVSVDQYGIISVPQNVTGVAHITATANDGSGVSATCTVTVKLSASLYYMYPEIEKTAGSKFINNSLVHTGDGTLSFRSSDTNVATVNASTGEVTISAGATVGQTVTITATVVVPENSSYIYSAPATSYTVKIVAPTAQGEREDYDPGSW